MISIHFIRVASLIATCISLAACAHNLDAECHFSGGVWGCAAGGEAPQPLGM